MKFVPLAESDKTQEAEGNKAPPVSEPATMRFVPLQAADLPDNLDAKLAAQAARQAQFAPGEEFVRGVKRAATADLPSLWEQIGVMKDAGAALTVGKRLDLFNKIDSGEITSNDQLRGLDLTAGQGRTYLASTPETRAKLRDRLTNELGSRKELIDASLKTLEQYQAQRKKLGARVEKLTDIENPTDFANWLASNVGAGAVNLAPIMLAAATTGGAGLLATGVTMGTAESVGNRLDALQKELLKTPADQRADKVIQRLKETGGVDLAVGVTSGLLDTLLGPAAALVKQTAKSLANQTRTGAAKQALKQTPRQMAEEFVTGGAQSLTQTAGKVAVDEQDKFLTKETFVNALNDAAAEAAGSPAGSAFNAARAALAAGAAKQTPFELQTGSILDTLGQEETDATRPISPTTRERTSVAGQLGGGRPTGGAAGVDADGMVPAGPVAGTTDAGEGSLPGALTQDTLESLTGELIDQGFPEEEARVLAQLRLDKTPRQENTLESLTAEFIDQGFPEEEARVLAQLELDRPVSQPRAVQGNLFGTFKGASRATQAALALARQDPQAALVELENRRERIAARQASGQLDANWAMTMAPQFGMTRAEGFKNPEKVAELFINSSNADIDQAAEAIRLRLEPRAMQGDLFNEEADVDKLEAALSKVYKPENQPASREEFGAEDAALAEDAAPTGQEEAVAEAEPAAPKAPPVEAPAVSTERVPNTAEGAQIVSFFDAVKPAAENEAEQERHGNSKNTAAGTMLEYDIAEPEQETSEGARKMLTYLANRVGGMEKFRALVAALRNADAEQQSQLFERAGLPDLTSRRGMDAFSAEVQGYADQVGGTKGGVRVGSPAVYYGRPYTENIQSTRTVTQEFGPTPEGKPRRPSQGQADTSHVIFDKALRAAVSALKQTIASGKKLSPQQQAAANYLNNTNRETFGEALYDLAYDLAYYELDPKNNGTNSTFAGEGGRQALAFQQWVNGNLDKSTSQVLDEMIAEHKKNAAENERFSKAVTKYHAQLDAYAENQRKDVETRTKKKVNRAPRKKKVVRIGDIEEVAPEDVVSEKNLPTVQMITEIHPALRRLLEQGKTDEALQILADAKGNPYYAALAQRLLDSGLTANTRLVDINTMETLSNDPAVKQAITEQLNTLSQIVAELYPVEQQATIVAGLRSTNLREVVSALGQMQSTLGQNNALPGQIEAFENTLDLFNRQYAWDGKYDPVSDSIVLRSGAGKLTNHVFLHEALHAASLHLIDNKDSLTGIQRQGYDRLVELYMHAKQVLSPNEYTDTRIYGLQDLHEFVSEALTNPVFQAQLRGLRYKAAPFSLWNAFTDSVRKLFNVKKGYESNAMVETMFATDAMLAGPMSLEGLVGSSGPKAMASKKTTRVKPMRPGMPNQPSAIKRLMTSRKWDSALMREFRSLGSSARPYALGVLTLRQLDDLIAGRLPQITNFIRVTEAFLSRKSSILQEAGDISKSWEALQSANPEMSQQIGRVMHMATIKEVDPDKAKTNQRNANQDLMIEWNKLDPRAKQVYRDVRDFYERRYSNYKRLMNRRVIQMRQLGVSEATITEIRNEFEKGKLGGPYFPLMRFGRFWYQIGKGTGREYYMFESEAARDKHIEERLQKDPYLADTIGTNIGNDYAKQMDYHARESAFLKAVFEAVDNIDVTGLSATDADAKKQELKDSYYQTYLSNQPDRSMRNQFIHRNNVAGYSEDALRSFATSSFNMAYQMARFEYSPEMFSQLDAAKLQLKDRYDPSVGYDPVVVRENDELRDYVGEVGKRLDNMLNPTDIGTIPSMLSNVGFIFYLSSIASAITNVLGGAIIGVPTLIGQQVKANPKMGYTAATAKVLYETGKTAAQIMMTGFNVEVGQRVVDSRLLSPSLERSDSLSSVERAAYNRFVADGLIDITATYDQSGLASTPTENYSGLRNKSMQVLSYAFHHAERFNREIMAMSAFRAAMEKRANMPNRRQAFAESVAEAKSLTNTAMFDYSSANKPRYFQSPIARIVWQFKQFPQQMTYFLTRNLLNSVKDLPPEQQKEARARFVGTMGMSAIFSGVTGIWGFSTVASIVNAVFSAVGGDDEEPFDFELAFVNWANETFGANMGTALTRGALNAATGLDIGSRVKTDEMWFRDGRKNQDEVEALQTFLVDLLGPTIGIGVNAARAVQLWNQGHGDRAIEAISPAFIKNALIAQRMSREGGATTLRGDLLTEDPSAFILMMQGLGLRSQELAERQFYNITVKGQEQEVLKKRQNVLNYYGLTFMSNDVEANEKAFEDIMKFNEKHPSIAIPAKSILNSIQERMKKSAETDRGLYIDKRLRESLLRQNYLADQ